MHMGVKGKEKAEQLGEKHSDPFGDEWKILCAWEICLSDLVPLPDDVSFKMVVRNGSLTHERHSLSNILRSFLQIH